jgi:Ca2+-binding EF-hand superfamily protein|eukprot:COSAG02_NODE_6281_length_3681_cov_8.325397_3_plen_109_part_00
MVNEVDMDGNGSIDFEEFLGMMTATQDNSSSFESEIIGAFATFDADDSGYISEEQLKSVVTNLGERLEDDELAAVIDTCKEKGWVDERGRISYRDFVLNEMQDSNGVD